MKLQIYRPLISKTISQAFGDNKACIYPNGRIVGKKGNICPSGSVDFYKDIGMNGHNGIDMSAWHGEPVYHGATFDGWMKVEKDASGGIGVDVVSNDMISIDGYTGYIKCRYWHLKAPVGYDKKQVKLGEQIGLADNTGSSSGDHLHFGIKKCDKDGNTLEPANGWNGCFDPTPYLNFDTDAKSAAEYLFNSAPPLSPQEQKEINSQLTIVRRLLLTLLEIKRKI